MGGCCRSHGVAWRAFARCRRAAPCSHAPGEGSHATAARARAWAGPATLGRAHSRRRSPRTGRWTNLGAALAASALCCGLTPVLLGRPAGATWTSTRMSPPSWTTWTCSSGPYRRRRTWTTAGRRSWCVRACHRAAEARHGGWLLARTLRPSQLLPARVGRAGRPRSRRPTARRATLRAGPAGGCDARPEAERAGGHPAGRGL